VVFHIFAASVAPFSQSTSLHEFLLNSIFLLRFERWLLKGDYGETGAVLLSEWRFRSGSRTQHLEYY